MLGRWSQSGITDWGQRGYHPRPSGPRAADDLCALPNSITPHPATSRHCHVLRGPMLLIEPRLSLRRLTTLTALGVEDDPRSAAQHTGGMCAPWPRNVRLILSHSKCSSDRSFTSATEGHWADTSCGQTGTEWARNKVQEKTEQGRIVRLWHHGLWSVVAVLSPWTPTASVYGPSR